MLPIKTNFFIIFAKYFQHTCDPQVTCVHKKQKRSNERIFERGLP